MQRLPRISLASDEPWPPRQALHVHGPNAFAWKFEAG